MRRKKTSTSTQPRVRAGPPRQARQVQSLSARRSQAAERERGDNLLGNIVLDVEDVRKVSVKALGPEMPACLCVNQLRRNAHPVAGFADTSFQDIADAQFLAGVAYIDIPAPEGEAGVRAITNN